MDKLLHERLREIENPEGDLHLGGTRVTLYRMEAQALADEIERYYIPCLLDDKGEPVQFGKEYEFGGNPFTARKMVIYGNGDVTVCDTFGGGHSYAPGERVKRHIEMLDADGDPIKVGDVVWGVKSGCKYEVTEVPHAHLFSTVDIRNVETGSTGGIYADQLTHKEPDTLLKVRDSLGSHYDEGEYGKIPEDINRLTALIERGTR